MKMISTLAVLAAASFFSGGCQSKGECTDGKSAACCTDTKAAAAGSTVNSMCVMNPSDKVSEGISTDYKGSKIGFCCAGCAGKFNALSDADKTAKLAKVGVTVK